MSLLPDTPKRFIAGAKCPQCKDLDKIVMFRSAGTQFQECVRCGHVEKMAFESKFRELETRVNQTDAERREAVAVVRLVDPDQQ